MRIETERLSLRPYVSADFEDYYGYIMEPELQHMLGLHDVNDRASAQSTFRWLMENREFIAVVSKATGKAIGHICLHPPYERVAEAPALQGQTGLSLSYAIAKEERRKGLMTEALKKLIDRLFQEEKADYIDCEYLPLNAASHALLKRLGFQSWCTEQLGGVELAVSLLRK